MTRSHALVTIDEAAADWSAFDAVIDVRAPVEFADDHIPSALNFPVLDDDQRALVGTMYAQESAFAARRVGAALTARNIAGIIEDHLAAMPARWRPLVYCWRGGERSGAMATVLERIGWRVSRLDGGYRAFRRHVIGELDRLPALLRFVVICGTTGSGKSRLLGSLVSAGAQVLDLEALASHRGSVLGALPDQSQPAQKLFESRVWNALSGVDPGRTVFVESESRKVGNLRVPEALMQRMRASACIELEVPVAQRVALLMDEYAHYVDDATLLNAQLACLTALHGRETITRWQQMARSGDMHQLVEELLVRHYDPAYRRSMKVNFAGYGAALRLPVELIGPGDFDLLARGIASDEVGAPSGQQSSQ